MDEEIESLTIQVRADTQEFARELGNVRSQLDGGFATSLERAGAGLERGLLGALRRGSLGFEDLRNVALSVLSDIASASLRTGLDSLFGGSSGSSGGLIGGLTNLASAALGLPGRSTGGPVSSGRPYLVGENGPEIFVPTTSGAIDNGRSRSGASINMTINVSDNGNGSAPDALNRSSRHMARAVRGALARADR